MPINIAPGGWSELDRELAVNKAGYLVMHILFIDYIISDIQHKNRFVRLNYWRIRGQGWLVRLML